MADPKHLVQLKKGPDEWNTWREGNPEVIPDLTKSDLRGANLSGANLSGANLSGANLSGANLDGTILWSTVLGDTNLRDVQGLESCIHQGPSIIDYPTLAQSWPLPLSFLRGCGLPDEFIDYLPSRLNQAIQFYSCFISYSTHDQAFAERLYADLQNKNVRCWFAPHDMQGGKKIHEQIDEAIRVYDQLLLILSDASMASKWVKTEIANALDKEQDTKKRVLFPISLVRFKAIRKWKSFYADIGMDSAREIREYFIPDFSDWKNHDKYQDQFAQLIKDLKAEDNTSIEADLPLIPPEPAKRVRRQRRVARRVV
jgi:TIR domain/Pentapeptide repeats (8 copies)